MGNKVTPSWSGALALWAGSDHYGLGQVLRRAPIELPIEKVTKVYEIAAKPLIGLGGGAKFAVEYRSEFRDCFVTLEQLPANLQACPRSTINPPGAFLQFFRHCSREPSALLLPLAVPFFTMVMMIMLGLWNDHVLHHPDVLAFFANPGCDTHCVEKVLRIHSMVAFLFLVQFAMVFLPLALLFFQAPRYKSALNYRMVQSYSFTTIVVGCVIFAQLVVFFPFKQYGRFLGLGFDPKVERMLNNLNK